MRRSPGGTVLSGRLLQKCKKAVTARHIYEFMLLSNA
jgi:hypothetical protein